MIPTQLPRLSSLPALAGSAALAEEPAVYWVSAPVQPGETVMVCGFFPQHEAMEVALERLPDGTPASLPAGPGSPPQTGTLPKR